MNKDRLAWVSGFAGLALIAIGGAAYYRERKVLAGVGGLGRARLREAPVVGGYSDRASGMRTQMRASKDMPIEERIATIQSLIHKSVQDPQMRKIALQVTSRCPERDKVCEARAIYDFVKARIRYTGDIGPIVHPDGSVEGIDLYQSARRTLEMGGGDCLPAGTLLLTKGHKFIPIEELIIGSQIWGRDAWTNVRDVWFKGVLPVDAVHLNNGSTFMATDEHKVYVALCASHPVQWDGGKSCTCPITMRSIERLTVAQLKPGMVLVQPERIAFGDEAQDPRRALIEGLFIADGWVGHEGDFDISGRDGHPKEEQKREIQALCVELGLTTKWYDKSIRVFDKEWTARMRQMGGKAWLKHALSINLDEYSADALLRGIMADSGKNTHGSGRTFTTTSRELMLQTRVLHRMFGRSCSERYIVDHGGAGEHPIHRLGVRDNDRIDGKAIKLLRVKEIDRGVAEKPVYDIATDDHYVYLPEADVVVSNCDDNSILNATLLALNGLTPVLRVVRQKGDPDWSHIFAGFTDAGKFIALDTTLPSPNSFGVEGRYVKKVDFPA